MVMHDQYVLTCVVSHKTVNRRAEYNAEQETAASSVLPVKAPRGYEPRRQQTLETFWTFCPANS